jgi:hypothetical protein
MTQPSGKVSDSGKEPGPKTVKVKTRDGTRTLFEGPESAAREWVANNFPRVHANPASPADNPLPDVVLEGEYYAGPEEEEPWKKVKDK